MYGGEYPYADIYDYHSPVFLGDEKDSFSVHDYYDHTSDKHRPVGFHDSFLARIGLHDRKQHSKSQILVVPSLHQNKDRRRR